MFQGDRTLRPPPWGRTLATTTAAVATRGDASRWMGSDPKCQNGVCWVDWVGDNGGTGMATSRGVASVAWAHAIGHGNAATRIPLRRGDRGRRAACGAMRAGSTGAEPRHLYHDDIALASTRTPWADCRGDLARRVTQVAFSRWRLRTAWRRACEGGTMRQLCDDMPTGSAQPLFARAGGLAALEEGRVGDRWQGDGQLQPCMRWRRIDGIDTCPMGPSWIRCGVDLAFRSARRSLPRCQVGRGVVSGVRYGCMGVIRTDAGDTSSNNTVQSSSGRCRPHLTNEAAIASCELAQRPIRRHAGV